MAIRPKGSNFAFRLNPDLEARKLAQQGLKERGGYCPCKVARTEENRCVCRNTRETGVCECGLLVLDEPAPHPSPVLPGEAAAEGFHGN